MNKQGNTYTIIYTSVMVIAVAFILAFAAIGLKPAQERNIAIDKMSQILNSVNITSTPENAQELYGKYIDDSFIINSKGELAKGESFSINIADQLKLPENRQTLPVFIYQGETPGLGAEIEKPQFQEQFQGKHFFIDGNFTSIAVEKTGQKPQNGADYVDAVSGGTITSKGVQTMLQKCVKPYAKFLESLNSKNI